MPAGAKNGSIRGFGELQVKFALPAFLSTGFIGISNHLARPTNFVLVALYPANRTSLP
jgi:hypothetical protein